MKYSILLPGLLIGTLLSLQSCQKKFSPENITALENELETKVTPGKVDSLLTLYDAAIKANPDDPKANLQYLTKAANLLYVYKKDGNGAAKYLDQAFSKYADGQDLADATGLYARVLYAFLFRTPTGAKMEDAQVVRMNEHLGKNTAWIDSNLVRLDRQMGSPVVTSPGKATAFVEAAAAYAGMLEQKNPDKYVDLMLKAAGLAKTINDPETSVRLYSEIAEKMPKHHKAPMALFMTGFVYENDLMDIQKAKTSYESFLSKYPEDPDFADDAQMALKMLGKSPEEIIKAAGNVQ